MVLNSCLLLSVYIYRSKQYVYPVYFALAMSMAASRQKCSLPFNYSALSAVASPTELCKDDKVHIVQKALQG